MSLYPTGRGGGRANGGSLSSPSGSSSLSEAQAKRDTANEKLMVSDGARFLTLLGPLGPLRPLPLYSKLETVLRKKAFSFSVGGPSFLPSPSLHFLLPGSFISPPLCRLAGGGEAVGHLSSVIAMPQPYRPNTVRTQIRMGMA